MSELRSIVLFLQGLFLQIVLLLIVFSAIGAVLATALAAFGVWPWIELQAGFGGTPDPRAGMIAQIGLTGLVLMLAFYLPANARILALERSHRNFSMDMNDVTRAYHAAHAADRAGMFTIASEFDAVRERLAFLRAHPELGNLEPGVLELAAQMSQVSAELAGIYSEEKVERARTFLRQRQEEIDLFNTRIEDAKIIVQELQRWTRDVEIEESVARSQLSRLREELFELMPELVAQLQGPPDGTDPEAASVVPMPPPRAAE